MNELQPIELQNKRVLTTQQLAEVYETETNNIKLNFRNNKNRFEEGRDFYLLKGNELKEFKNQVNDINLVNKHATALYLWTERGANRHSKILDTDKAWKQFDVLEETYFKVKNDIPRIPQSNREIIQVLLGASEETNQRLDKIDTRVTELENTTTIVSGQQNKLTKVAKNTAVRVLGGIGSTAYKQLSKKVFSHMWRDYLNYFKISSYKDTLKVDFEKGLNYLEGWRPEYDLELEIQSANNQMSLEI